MILMESAVKIRCLVLRDGRSIRSVSRIARVLSAEYYQWLPSNGTTFSTVLPVVNADTLKQAISPVVDRDIVLVSDGHRGYPPCATAMGVRHDLSAANGPAFHIHGQQPPQPTEGATVIATKISTTTCNGFISSNSHHRPRREPVWPLLSHAMHTVPEPLKLTHLFC